jgi:hypothetical protein
MAVFSKQLSRRPTPTQDYPPCRLSLGLLFSSDPFFPAAVAAASRFVRERGWARLVVVNKADPNNLADQVARHAGALGCWCLLGSVDEFDCFLARRACRERSPTQSLI